MVGSAVLGAAAGTGLALVVAMTIVVYRYYTLRRRTKEWGELGGWSDVSEKDWAAWAAAKEAAKKPAQRSKNTLYTVQQKEFTVPKEPHAVQPVQQVPAHSVNAELLLAPLEVTPNPLLHHQSRSYPAGTPLLARTPSVSSQSSLDSGPSRQSHRGSSPQIRTYAPDGRSTLPSSSYPPHGSHGSRSPSPSTVSGDMRTTPSPSQVSLSSLTSVAGSYSMCGSPQPAPSANSPRVGRCLSPLLIPPRSSGSDSGSLSSMPPASPLGAIQPDLYTRREGPLFLGGGPRTGPPLGRLHLRLKYDYDRSDLTVHLIEAHDLAGSEQGGFNDPYVRVSMLPEVDTRKRQTAIHRNDPHPYYDQHFKFPVSHEELQDKVLLLQVFDYDRFSRNDVVGEVRISMADMDLSASVEVWGDITRSKRPPEERQEVLLSLSYLPSAERLTVVLLKARNLYLPKDKEGVDPYVKVYLVVGGKRVKKKKTAARKGSDPCNPVWNEAVTFSLSSANLSNAAVEICVVTQGADLIGHSGVVGACGLGPREGGAGRDHWLDMAQSPRKTTAMWHSLR